MFRELNKFAGLKWVPPKEFPVESAIAGNTFAPIKDRLQQKTVDLAVNRGFKVPTLPTRFPGQPPEVDFKALGNMRLSGPAISPTVEREILNLHSPVADNIPAQLKHRFLGTPRRALHNVTGALARHPYLTAAGVGAAALGVRQYLKHRAAKQQAEQAPEEPKMAALVPPPPVATIAPRPPVPGDIKMPKPSTKSPVEATTKKSPGTASSAPTAATKVAFDPAIAALLAAAAGGTGGYFFGKKVLEPLAGGRVDALKETISEAERAMGRWETVKEFAPAGAAAAGAILLAALAANHARKDEREKLRNMTGRSYRQYDPNGSDYSPDSREAF